MGLTFWTCLAIGLAFVFDFLNGFHDAANSIATVVSTRVLKPIGAVVWAAFFNFVAFLIFDLQVASTIGQGLIDPHLIDVRLIISALLGAICWNLLTWWYGLPASSSHALIGGLVGAAVQVGGWGSVMVWSLLKIVGSIFISPFLGLCAGSLLVFLSARLAFYQMPQRANTAFRMMQLLSSALISLGHGGNDAQKTMGLVTAILLSVGSLQAFEVPSWVVVSCNGFIALGTLFGGWRIVRTMGMKITKLSPMHGFSAETGAACTLFLATQLGVPVSTTHTLTGAVIGTGLLGGASAIRWGIATRIVWAWFFTLPASAFVSALVHWILGRLEEGL